MVVSNKRYEVLEYSAVSDPKDLLGENNRSLLKWWLSFAPEIPKKTDFDILDHVKIAPDIFLVKRLSETTFEFRLHGESANDIFDDYTGKIIHTDSPETSDRQAEEVRLARYYCEMLKTPKCIRNYGNLSFINKSHVKFESVDCPLLDENGEMNYIIGTITTLDSDQ